MKSVYQDVFYCFKDSFHHLCRICSNKPMCLCFCSTRFLKTLEKEKLLVRSNFYFSHSMIYPFENFVTVSSNLKLLIQMLPVLKSLKFVVRERVTPFLNKPWFLCVCIICLLKTQWEKEKLLVVSNFSFSHSVFYLFQKLSAIFIKFEIVVCKLFQFGRI